MFVDRKVFALYKVLTDYAWFQFRNLDIYVCTLLLPENDNYFGTIYTH